MEFFHRMESTFLKKIMMNLKKLIIIMIINRRNLTRNIKHIIIVNCLLQIKDLKH